MRLVGPDQRVSGLRPVQGSIAWSARCGRAHDRAARAALHQHRTAKEQTCLLVIDIDRFKSVNDLYGHIVGDDVLKMIGLAIRNSLRSNDIAGRYGGDEFVIMQNGITKEEWVALVRRIVADVARTMKTDGLPVTLSAGATHIVRSASLEELMHECDLLMYRAKSQGRNRVESD